MNETLESIPRVTFKSWFVDFDPVRANAESRQPYDLDAETAALFPDAFEDSPLGKIPAGWTIERLSDVVEFAYGRALKDSVRRPGAVPVFGSNGQVGWHDEALVKGPGIIVGRKGNPGIVTWVPSDFYPIDTTFYVVSKHSNTSLHYLYFLLAGMDLPALGSDSAVPGLNRNIAYMSHVLLPSSDAMKAFHETRDLLTRRALVNVNESRTLAELRDALLPKLLSGEVRVKDAERFAAKHA